MTQRHWLLAGMLTALCLGACSSAPTDLALAPKTSGSQSYRPLALGSTLQGTARWDDDAQRTYLAVPARVATPKTKPTATDKGFSKGNWSYSVKQKDRIQVYIVQTPDWFEVVEQELPRHRKDFNRIEEAIAYANERYPDWSLVSLEP